MHSYTFSCREKPYCVSDKATTSPRTSGQELRIYRSLRGCDVTQDHIETRGEPKKALERWFSWVLKKKMHFHANIWATSHWNIKPLDMKWEFWWGHIPALEVRAEWFHSDWDTMSYCAGKALWDRSGATGTLNRERRWQKWPRTLATAVITHGKRAQTAPDSRTATLF